VLSTYPKPGLFSDWALLFLVTKQNVFGDMKQSWMYFQKLQQDVALARQAQGCAFGAAAENICSSAKCNLAQPTTDNYFQPPDLWAIHGPRSYRHILWLLLKNNDHSPLLFLLKSAIKPSIGETA